MLFRSVRIAEFGIVVYRRGASSAYNDALSLERKNAEKRKIPNPSLTVGIMTYRRNTVLEIEFIHNVCYNYIDAVLSFISAI